jgi:hypothetical protein
MKKTFIIFSMVLAISFSTIYMAAGSTRDTLCTPNPSKEAVALYRYLLDMKGKKILSGQMWAPYGGDELNYIKSITGKQPAIRGADFISQSDNANEVQYMKDWWNAGGIPTIMWHWGAPTKGEGYDQSKMSIPIDSCFATGTPESIAFWSELKTKADLLVQLRDAHVPVLWRPYHELNGGWFWWSMGGPERFKKLWTTMFNYFVNVRGLNNLIWVLCYDGTPDAAWYPGDQYVDVAGADTYGVGSSVQLPMYNNVRSIVGDTLPIAYHECGVPPDPDQCLAQGAMWSWWMEWHTTYIHSVDTNYLKLLYHHDLIITLDKVPNIMSVYGWNKDSCSATIITPKLQVDGGLVQQKNIVKLGTGSSVKFSPIVVDSGSWKWSGCGISDTSREQTVGMVSPCISTATFTNKCGATSTQTFNIIECSPTSLAYELKINNGSWLQTSNALIYPGSTVTFNNIVPDSGTWHWTGCGISDTSREQTFIPDSSCTLTVTYINECGQSSTKQFKVILKSFRVGISNIDENMGIKLYPDPCNEVLNIEIKQLLVNQTFSIYIYSIDGILVQKEITDLNHIVINTSKLEPNLYFIKIVGSNFEALKKFIKVK